MNIMSMLQPPTESFPKAITSYILLSIAYILLVLLVPINRLVERAYNLTNGQYRVLLLVIALPSLLSWFAGFYSYAKLELYGRSIGSAPEGVSFQRLARGCLWLAWSLPVSAIVSELLRGIANNHIGFSGTAIIVGNYVAMVLPLIGFIKMSAASRGLAAQSGLRLSLNRARFVVLAFVVAGVVYCYLTFRQLGMMSLGSTSNPYHMPVWLVVLSLTIPYLYGWFLGALASFEVGSFSLQVRGVLYRRSLQLLSAGLVVVILSFIALQYIQSVAPIHRAAILGQRLIWLYIFQLLGGTGFVLIAFGVNRLKKIEDV